MLAPIIAKRSFSVTTQLSAVKKKIEVQLLKDFQGLGRRGEIVKVLPSRMMNQLHINNGATYILSGQPLRIPKVKAQEIVEPVVVAEVVKERVAVKEKPQLAKTIGDVNFDFANILETTTESTDDDFYKIQALQSIKLIIHFSDLPQAEGVLSTPITKAQITNRLLKLTGYEFNSEELKLVKEGSEKKELLEITLAGNYSIGLAKGRQTVRLVVS